VKIRRVHLYRVVIPFKRAFRHSTRERDTTDNLVVETQLEDGSLGYGEGLPRDYVTGETQEGVIAALQKLPAEVFTLDCQDLSELVAFLDSEILSRRHFPEDRGNNTARCALELSLLDAFSKSFRKSFSDVAALALHGTRDLRRTSPLYYDGVVSLGTPGVTAWSSLKMKLFGFKRLKVKLDADTEAVPRTLRWVRRMVGRDVDVRVDANEAWDLDTASRMAEALRDYSVSSLEQPMPHAERMQMAELKKRTAIPLMLDESLCTWDDAKAAIEHGLCDLFNIRLSKCGGFLNSLRIAALAREHGLGYQLGCMVGETGILSAAGRQFASLDPKLRYLEGSYDRYFLTDNIVEPDISFGRKGRAEALEGYGLGVRVNPAKLSGHSVFDAAIFG
jgi:muconate cycloisomerase